MRHIHHHYYGPMTEGLRKVFKVVGGVFLGFAGILFLAALFCLFMWLSDNSGYDIATFVLGLMFVVFSFLGSIFMIIAIYGRNKTRQNDDIVNG